MKLSELYDPSEAVLLEGFLDTLKRQVGARILEPVHVVRNSANALAVIYKVTSNPSYLETFTFLLKKRLLSDIRAIPHEGLRETISRFMPRGRGLKDFLTALVLTCVVSTVFKGHRLAAGEIIDAMMGQLGGLPNLIGSLATGGPIGPVLKTLQIGNDILFAILTTINKKIEGVAGIKL